MYFAKFPGVSYTHMHISVFFTANMGVLYKAPIEKGLYKVPRVFASPDKDCIKELCKSLIEKELCKTHIERGLCKTCRGFVKPL